MTESDNVAVAIALHKVTDAKLRLSKNYDIVRLLDKATLKEDRELSTNYYFTSDIWWKATVKGPVLTDLFYYFGNLQTIEFAYIQIDYEELDGIEIMGDPHRYGMSLSREIVRVNIYNPPTIERLEE